MPRKSIASPSGPAGHGRAAGRRWRPIRRGVLQRAPVPVLGATYARAAAPVQCVARVRPVRIYSADGGARSRHGRRPATGSSRWSAAAGWASSTARVQLGLERIVALKVIAPELLDDDDVRARFLAEARAAASVDHPNVIPVHDGGRGRRRRLHRDALRRRRRPALAGARAAARSTRPRRRSSSRRPARRWTRSTAPASSTATSSPRTCSSTPSGHVYLTDFGLAKAVLTRSGGDAHRPVGRDARLRRAGADPRRARSTPAPTSTRSAACCTSRSPAACRSSARATRRSCGRSSPRRRRCRRRCGAGCRPQFDARRSRARWPRTPDERYPSAGDLGRAARAAAAGATPTEPERMVARGAAAPGAAPTEPGWPPRPRRAPPARPARAGRAARRAPLARRRRARPPRRSAPCAAVAARGAAATPSGDAASRRGPRADADADRHGRDGVARARPRRSRTSATGRAGSRSRAATCGSRARSRRGSPASTRRRDASAATTRRSGRTSRAIVAYRRQRLGRARQHRAGRSALDARTRRDASRGSPVAGIAAAARRRRARRLGRRPTRRPATRQRAALRPASGRAAADDRGPRGRRRAASPAPERSGSSSATRTSSRGSTPGADRLASTGRAARAACARCATATARCGSTLDGEDTIARVEHATGAAASPAPPGTPRRRRSSPAAACSSPAATTTRSSCSTPRRCAPVGEPIPVGLNPLAMAADGRSVWVTGARRQHAHPDRLSLSSSQRARASAARFCVLRQAGEPEALEQRRQRALDGVDREHQLVGDLRGWRPARRSRRVAQRPAERDQHAPLGGRDARRGGAPARASRVGAASTAPSGAQSVIVRRADRDRRRRAAAAAGRARARR